VFVLWDCFDCGELSCRQHSRKAEMALNHLDDCYGAVYVPLLSGWRDVLFRRYDRWLKVHGMSDAVSFCHICYAKTTSISGERRLFSYYNCLTELQPSTSSAQPAIPQHSGHLTESNFITRVLFTDI